MIQAPITKTGDIRYFEFIKIFVLVAFFVALGSVITERPEYFMQINPVVPTTALNSILFVTIISSIVTDLRQIFTILKEVIITYIPVYYFKIKENIMEFTVSFISIIKRDLLQSKLCVIRC